MSKKNCDGDKRNVTSIHQFILIYPWRGSKLMKQIDFHSGQKSVKIFREIAAVAYPLFYSWVEAPKQLFRYEEASKSF